MISDFNMKINQIFNSAFGAIVIVAMLASCRDAKKFPGYEFMPDMYRSPSYETYSENNFFKDSLSERTPVKGSIPRGFTVFNFDASTEGYIKASEAVKRSN